MAAATRARDDWRPGDVLITNDPFTTGGMVTHLNDILVFRPVFAGGELLCFTWAFIHFTDVGGHAPGRWGHPIAIAYYVIAVMVVAGAIYLTLPETKDRSLAPSPPG